MLISMLPYFGFSQFFNFDQAVLYCQVVANGFLRQSANQNSAWFHRHFILDGILGGINPIRLLKRVSSSMVKDGYAWILDELIDILRYLLFTAGFPPGFRDASNDVRRKAFKYDPAGPPMQFVDRVNKAVLWFVHDPPMSRVILFTFVKLRRRSQSLSCCCHRRRPSVSWRCTMN